MKLKIGDEKCMKGWVIGIISMQVGEKAIVKIRSDYAFGEKGNPGIPPNSNLIFHSELIQCG